MMRRVVNKENGRDYYAFETNEGREVSMQAGISKKSDTSYNDYIVGSPLAKIPLKSNFGPEDVGQDVNVTRMFILPGSKTMYNALYTDVEHQIAPHDIDSLHCNIDGGRVIGTNYDNGQEGYSNGIKTLYTMYDGRQIMMTFSIDPDMWNCFGVQQLSVWKSVGRILIANACDWFIYGYSDYHDLDDDESRSKGVVTNMQVIRVASFKRWMEGIGFCQ